MSQTARRAIIAVMTVAALIAVVVFAVQNGDGECEKPTLAIASDAVELLETADGLELVVTAEEDFYMGALLWILRIGRLEFDRSYHPDGALTRLAFPIPATAVEMLADGDGIDVRYGNPIGSAADGFARADLDVDRESGFATLRVTETC